MNCKKCQNLIAFYIQDDLNPEEKIFLEDHLRDCSECSQVLKRERIVVESIDRDSLSLPEPDWEASWRVISAPQQKDVKGWKRLAIQTAGVLVIFIAGALIGRFVLFPTGKTEAIPVVSPLHRYFSQVGPALTVFMNTSMDRSSEYEAEMEKKIIQEMLAETRLLKQGMYEQDSPYLHRLFDELEIILIEISNLKYGDERTKKMIMEMIQAKEISFKLKALDSSGSYSF